MTVYDPDDDVILDFVRAFPFDRPHVGVVDSEFDEVPVGESIGGDK